MLRSQSWTFYLRLCSLAKQTYIYKIDANIICTTAPLEWCILRLRLLRINILAKSLQGTTTKMKVAKVRPELKTVGTAD